MASTYFGDKIKLKLDIESEQQLDNYGMGYPFKAPDEVYLEGYGEEYYPQCLFSWIEDGITFKRGNRVFKYTRENCSEIKALVNGKEVWIKGDNAPYENSEYWQEVNGHYIRDENDELIFRDMEFYKVDEYDIETGKHRSYEIPVYNMKEETLSKDDANRYFNENEVKDFLYKKACKEGKAERPKTLSIKIPSYMVYFINERIKDILDACKKEIEKYTNGDYEFDVPSIDTKTNVATFGVRYFDEGCSISREERDAQMEKAMAEMYYADPLPNDDLPF